MSEIVESAPSIPEERATLLHGAVAVAPAPPALAEAFHLLCAAMLPYLEEDVPAQMKCEEIQAWHTNGNTAMAWTHAFMLLEGILGATLHH